MLLISGYNEDMDMVYFELIEKMVFNVVIKVVGVGGGGGNVVVYMVNLVVDGVEFIIVNIDLQVIKNCGVKLQLQLGINVIKGLGVGVNLEVGCQVVLEDCECIMDVLQGVDMVFIIVGMGGGIGIGVVLVVVQLVKEMGILIVVVVIKLFLFEGCCCMQVVLKGIEELSQYCDLLIMILNEKLIIVLGCNVIMIQVFCVVNDVLQGVVQGIVDLIVCLGLINVDFVDVCIVMFEMGLVMMGIGIVWGDDCVQVVVELVIQNLLLDDVNLVGVNGILVNIIVGVDFIMVEFDEIGCIIDGFVLEDVIVVVGIVLDLDMQDEVCVIVVVIGLNCVLVSKIQCLGECVLIKLVCNVIIGQLEFGEFDNGGDVVFKVVGGMGLGLGLCCVSSDIVVVFVMLVLVVLVLVVVELLNDYLDILVFLCCQVD